MSLLTSIVVWQIVDTLFHWAGENVHRGTCEPESYGLSIGGGAVETNDLTVSNKLTATAASVPSQDSGLAETAWLTR